MWNWNLRKLYAEIPGYNWDQFESGNGDFFELEATLLDHDYSGRYWPQFIVSIGRSQWEEMAPSLFSSLYLSVTPDP